MDPVANMYEQLELAKEIDKLQEFESDGGLAQDTQLSERSDEVYNLAGRLTMLIIALDEWRYKGGYDPYQEMVRKTGTQQESA